MKRTLFFKRSLMGMFCLFICSFSFGQGYYLPVSNAAQEDDQWCWAASMHMVFNFHESIPNDAPTQCELVQRYLEMDDTRSTNHDPQRSYDSDCCTECGENGSCNFAIPYSKRNSYIDYPFIDLLFSFFGYNSIEDVETQNFDWVDIVKEIESCRPFMILLQKNPTNSSTDSYEHTVVAKGFYENNNKKYILANDPQTDGLPTNSLQAYNCGQKEVLLPLSILSDPIPSSPSSNSIDYNNAFQVVRFVHPKGQDLCNSCDDIQSTKNNIHSTENNIQSTDNNYFITVLESMDLDWIFENDTINLGQIPNNDSLNLLARSRIRDEEYFFNDFIMSDSSGRALESLKVLVVRKGENEITITLEKTSATGWIIREIGMATYHPFKKKIQVKNPKKIFCKKETLSASKGEFEVVEFSPNFYKFYRYPLNGQSWVTPIRDYDRFAKKGMTYLEKEILDKLKKERRKKIINLKQK